MKILFLTLVLSFSAVHVHAQKFESKFSLTLPADIAEAQVEWADLDNDSLLDVVVIGKKIDGEVVLLTAKNNADTTFSWMAMKSTGYKDAAYQLVDYNLDNRVDVILSGVWNTSNITATFFNNGDFTFQTAQPIISVASKIFRFADLDQDGGRELLINEQESGGVFLNLYKQSGIGWVKKDSIPVELSALEVFDFDGDIDQDIFISGHNQDSIFSTLLYNEGSFNFYRITLARGFAGSTSIGDLNQDGMFDIVLAGKSLGNPSVVVYHNLGKRFEEKMTLPALSNAKSFVGDLNSDGEAEINLIGTMTGDSINLLYHPNDDYDTLQSIGLIHQQFGDADRDGDLDLIQLMLSDSLRLVFLYNTTAEQNRPPRLPFNPVGSWIFNRLFLHWDKPGDDHTPVSSITYDLTIEAATAPIMVGDFDQENHRRILVSHGNQGTKNFNLLKGLPNETMIFSIQAVDNSFHAGPHLSKKGICEGIIPPGGKPCVTQAIQYIDLCQNEDIVLTAYSNSLWFSFASGYLGTSRNFEVKATATDTLFSFTPGADICSAIQVYVLSVKTNLVKLTEKVQYVCEGSLLHMEVEEGWNTVEWSSSAKGFISNDNTITYMVTTADTVRTRLSNSAGCRVQRNTILKISKPVVILAGETFQILKGTDVQLHASGGVTYSWQPYATLNNKDIPNPIASPLTTTEYTVTVTDSIGCAASAKVLVIVEQTAFVPNLFTPNADGKNDALKVYGLVSVRDFIFTIYNREGSVVYETNDVSEVISHGWDGSVKGIKQASGIYYWKVKGEYVNGGSLLLNGKKSGSVVLIR